jgi:uncharacterized lipoprotein NlpE involved in copper resistance
MMKTKLALLVLLAVSLTGCNSASSRLIGTWKFDFAKAAAKQADKMMGANNGGTAASALGMAQTFGMKMEMTFEFKSDQTVNIATTGIPFPFTGLMNWKTIKSDGDNLVIEITNPEDKKTSQIQIAFIDNDHLRFSPPDSNAKSMEFERIKQ